MQIEEQEDGLIKEYCMYMKKKGYRAETIRTSWYILKRYEGYITGNYSKRLDRVVETEIRNYCKRRKEKTNIKNMVKEFDVIRGFYKYCNKLGLTLYDVTERIEVPKIPYSLPKYIPSEEEVKEFLNAPSENTLMGIRDRAILEVMYSAGLRRKELINLKVSDIDLKERLLIVKDGKGGKDRVLPIGKRAIESVEKYLKKTRPEYIKNLGEDHLFLTREKGSINPSTMHGIFKRYRGIKKISPHTLRHACALHMLRGGAPIEKIQEMLGHAGLKTTQIYTRLCPKDVKESHKKSHPRERRIHGRGKSNKEILRIYEGKKLQQYDNR